MAEIRMFKDVKTRQTPLLVLLAYNYYYYYYYYYYYL